MVPVTARQGDVITTTKRDPRNPLGMAISGACGACAPSAAESRGYRVGGSHSLVNDVLIVLSARMIGATVVTSNARDFTAIREVRPFKLSVVPA